MCVASQISRGGCDLGFKNWNGAEPWTLHLPHLPFRILRSGRASRVQGQGLQMAQFPLVLLSLGSESRVHGQGLHMAQFALIRRLGKSKFAVHGQGLHSRHCLLALPWSHFFPAP